MALWQNIPFFCIIFCLLSAAITSVLKGNRAKYFCMIVVMLVIAASGVLCYHMVNFDGAYTYMMGHFPAPWGNEIRVGILEAVMATVFSSIMLLCLMGGDHRMDEHVGKTRKNLYYVIVELLTAALLAQVYTNDLFTAYVFLEIMTIAGGALIASRTKGHTLVAATRYMIMNLIGSGLFLLGITLLYDLTGHLLMSDIQRVVLEIHQSGAYQQPLTVVIVLLTVGLSIKSALFPFHTWVPDAYSYSTPSTSAIMSSLVSKGYMFLLIKIYYRTIGLEVIRDSNILIVVIAFGLIAMILGSIDAIKEKDIRRMVAFSSVAQTGYIFMGIGMGTEYGMAAAIFHICSHSLIKAMLYLSTGQLTMASSEYKTFRQLRGAGIRNPLAGVAFVTGAFSIVGIPFLSGFISKLLFAQAAMDMHTGVMLVIMATLTISTLLNTLYFLRTVITIYRPAVSAKIEKQKLQNAWMFNVAMAVMVAFNVILGVMAQPVISAITKGLTFFG